MQGEAAARTKDLEPEWRRAFEWVGRTIGGRVVRWERQPRWRPAWFLDVERDGAIVPIYFRGDRGALDHGVYPLEHEMRILQLLERHAVPVPHVYGFCPDPRGIVMQRSPGRGTAALAQVDPAERDRVMDDYVEIVARMHRIDVAEAEAIGLERPQSAEQLGLGDLAHWERAYRKEKRRPEPWIEFVLRWLRRNVPRHRTRPALLQADSGQFLFERGRITALHDFELSYLGDPMAEFAGLRNRTLSEPVGDMRRLIRHYEAQTGEPADLAAIDYHTARFGLATPLSTCHIVADPPPGVELVQYLAWYLVYGRLCIEVIAHRIGQELAPIAERTGTPTRHSSGHRALLGMLAPSQTDSDAIRRYERATAERAARYLARADLLGPELEQEDLDEAGALLGRRPADWRDADAKLEALVASAGPEHDGRLVHYFHRHILRHETLLEGALRELEGAVIEHLD